ncbi:MAG: hypothetical protein R6W93_13695 [Candidatus Limnocylindrales bacterium]
MTARSDDLALLQAYEPVVRYTKGELFFPASVEGYIAACDLLVGTSEDDARILVPQGRLTTGSIAAFDAPPGQSLYLRLVQKPLGGIELQRWRLRPDRVPFSAPGRLARVGLFARLLDAGFAASLLLRGSVPGGTAAAAQIKYAAAHEADPRFVYHGRVVRSGGWITLHYLYFYFMNDYRSTFHGVNDHEADWEQVFIYLEDAPGGPRPVWIAAAAHDYTGDELRRRWDDPTLEIIDGHPVINAGAGSHASYFERGEYLTEVPIPALQGLASFLEVAREFWRDTLRQPDPGDLRAALSSALSVPFVDYARGDGVAIGPGQVNSWSPVLIDDAIDWVDGYRGLFGLDTHDRFAGERAPAGPKYTRSGTVRQSWNDPLGFAGLDKVAPPHRQPELIAERILELETQASAVAAEAARLSQALPGLELEVRSLAESGSTRALHETRAAELEAGEAELAALRARGASIRDAIGALRGELTDLEAGDLGDPQGHLRHPHRPVPPEETRYNVLVEIWSAVSVGVLLLVVAGLVFVRLVPWWGALLVGLVGYILIESALRRRLTRLLLRSVLILAVVGALILVVDFALELVLLAVVGLALVVVLDNVREVSGR